MQVTKMGHACIRLEKSGQTLVIDPGSFSDPDAVLGADAVLITHEHLDHFDEGSLRRAAESNPGVEIWTNGSVAAKVGSLGVPVHVVGHGDAFTAAVVHGYLRDTALDQINETANRVGAWVASQSGATPAPKFGLARTLAEIA